jgi:DNA-binding response OmpR family regulator
MLGNVAPLAIIVQIMPHHDAAALGAMLREGRPDTMLVGLFSIQLSVTTLKTLLQVFDDVVLIPCAPDALVARIRKLERLKKRGGARI